MKNLLSLMLIVGLLVAGWMNRDKLAGLWGKKENIQEEVTIPVPEEVAPPAPPSPSGPAATPHPAREAQAEATRLYPGLTVPNSALNKKFVALYRDAQSTDPALLTRPDWPIQLAERAMIQLGGAPMPRRTPGPSSSGPLPGGTLDQSPQPHRPK